MDRLTRPKSATEVAIMREGGAMLATVLSALRSAAVAGVTTRELAELARRELLKLGGQPAFEGFHGYPDVLCVSLNDAIVHGIPDETQLRTGDILSLDFGVRYQGLITDAAISLIVDRPRARREAELVAMTEAALHAGIDTVRAGSHVGDIGAAVEAALHEAGFGIVRELVGHGVGEELHEAPNIPNYGRPGEGMKLQAGMTVAIEPMATLGGHHVRLDRDGWTVRTRDGTRAAHFEHTIVVTETGADILTSLN